MFVLRMELIIEVDSLACIIAIIISSNVFQPSPLSIQQTGVKLYLLHLALKTSLKYDRPLPLFIKG